MIIGSEKEKEIVFEAERLDIKDKAPLVLLELLFDANMLQQIKQFKSLLRRVCLVFACFHFLIMVLSLVFL